MSNQGEIREKESTTNEHPSILFRCQHYENALSTFDEHNYGDHQ